jgi:serine/threonine-protein kinase
MGDVYRADDLRLGQRVALKFLSPALESDPVAHERLLAEVRSARTISHPNVCRVYDVGEEAGRSFLTMEYIDGEDLASLLRRIGRLPGAKALEVAHQVCAGLAAAHGHGVLHRDLKPANVMIDSRGLAKISDFGIAVEAGRADSSADIAGTAAYMAPECFAGRPATVQSDLYALGLVLYEALTGRPPFVAATLGEWERAHRESPPPSPASLATDVDPTVERVVLRCLEKDPARRPASAAAIASSLPGWNALAAAAASGETPSPELVAASGDEGTLSRKWAWLALAGCLALLAVSVLLLGSVSLANLLPPGPSPELLENRARQILADLGYVGRAADSAWWVRDDDEARRYLSTLTPVRRRFDEIAAVDPAPLRFCYRQSPGALAPLDPAGRVDRLDPPPVEEGDVYLELDLQGRLLVLQVVPSRDPPAAGAPGVPSWDRLVSASGLDVARLRTVESQWTPPGAYDERVSMESTSPGQELRVDAAAWRGSIVSSRLVAATRRTRGADVWRPERTLLELPGRLAAAVFLGTLVILGAFARHNLRSGRGDRKRAWRLALVTFGASAVWVNVGRHWTVDPASLWRVLVLHQGLPFALALQAWLSYLGLEPYVRRRWPELLVSWTRLLDGRWRDGLVGRALLIGVTSGLAYNTIPAAAVVAGRLLDLAGVAPVFFANTLDGTATVVGLEARGVVFGTLYPLGALALLLVARFLVRHDGVAWMVMSVPVFVVIEDNLVASRMASAANPGLLLTVGALMTVVFVTVLRRGGLLALSVASFIWGGLFASLFTFDVSRWYAWRGWISAVLIAGLAVWGFRNVLGRQSALPAGALE